jgi:hypothetical protein
VQHFSNAGWLFPNYNKAYWLGLQNSSLPDASGYDFQWLDPHTPGPDYSTYSAWGWSDARQEPYSNGLYLENCAVAALALSWEGAWGWDNVNCSSKQVAICRLQEPGLQPMFTHPVNNHSYLLNTSTTNQAGAEALCQASGGHLVSYGSLQEQQDVEGHFVNGGFVFPAFHKVYWIGLVTNSTAWPKFRWVDSTPTLGLGIRGYEAWGTYMPGSSPEPNNFPAPPELCGVANATQPMLGVWGWADANCISTRAAFMCELLPPGPFYSFTSNRTNSTYILNTKPATFTDAEAFCSDQGGHLVSYGNLREQVCGAASNHQPAIPSSWQPATEARVLCHTATGGGGELLCVIWLPGAWLLPGVLHGPQGSCATLLQLAGAQRDLTLEAGRWVGRTGCVLLVHA